MFQTLDEATSFIRHKSVAMVDLKFCDLWGRWRHVTLPAGRFNPDPQNAEEVVNLHRYTGGQALDMENITHRIGKNADARNRLRNAGGVANGLA